ncbi:MAG: metallophosphoesterase family protein [Chitinivibrionales bacterium]|nr:metallophosphoesterase family protein [Chitinivibrionales bacterium]
MKIGIVSDTHRNTKGLLEVSEWLIAHRHVAAVYHLGDDFDDTAILADLGIDVVHVPGIYDKNYLDGSVKPKLVENILGLSILLVHFLEKDTTENDRTVSDIILYGHTHRAEMRLADGKLFMNPGHLKSNIDKNLKQSFGLIDIQDKNVVAQIFDLDYKVIESVELIRSEMGLYKA